MNSQHCIFICGALRSGSTLLHLMLDHHPNIKNPGEFDFMFDLVRDNGDYPQLNAYYEFLDRNRIFKSKNLTIDSSLSYQELIHSFVKQLMRKNQILALNVHRNFHRIPYVFPEARYIHLLRDPRDVARSSIEMGWRGNVYFGVDHWLDTEKSWDELDDQLTPEQYTTIYYEQLIEDPEAELKKLCTFVGLPYSQAMLEYPEHSSYKKPDKSLTQQWKKKLATREVQYVESKAIDLLQRRGYKMSGFPLIQVTSAQKFKLSLQNKIFRTNHGLKRYGAVLYFGEKITNFLGLNKLNKKYLLQKNEIDRKHLR